MMATRELLEAVLAHLEECEEAWRTGALHDIDGRGAARSNRNVWLARVLRRSLRDVPFPLDPNMYIELDGLGVKRQ